MGVIFKMNIKTLEWELSFRIGKWIFVFRWFDIVLWRLSPIVIYYLAWTNPYTKKFHFAMGKLPEEGKK